MVQVLPEASQLPSCRNRYLALFGTGGVKAPRHDADDITLLCVDCSRKIQALKQHPLHASVTFTEFV